MRRYVSELVERTLDRSGVTPGLIVDVTQHFARAAQHFMQASTRTTGLVGHVPPT